MVENNELSTEELINISLKTAKVLRDVGAIVDHAVCVVDRESGGFELLKENGIKLVSVAKISELL